MGEQFGEIECVSVAAVTNGDIAIRGQALQPNDTGVQGVGDTGVWGRSGRTGFGGVFGEHTGSSGFGVIGNGKGTHDGVLGRNSSGTGVRGQGSTGVIGESTSAGSGFGVEGIGKGDAGAGVVGRNSDGAGVWGRSGRTGFGGVFGQHIGSSGYGVIGVGRGSHAGVIGRNSSGYGGHFEGGKAQLLLTPGSSAGRPTSGDHTKGEIYMDSAGELFVCTANGTPGMWSKITTTVAP